MTCHVCGRIEGEGPCIECRALALEMIANREALAELRHDEIPLATRLTPRRRTYGWLAAAAALVLLGLVLPQFDRHRLNSPHEAPTAPTASLTIKMLTPDPTVVIYWLADTKLVDKKEKTR
jgi:hypothetical protein